MSSVAPNLFMLAIDHRSSLERDVYGLQDEPSPADAKKIEHGKSLVYDGLELAVARGVDRASAGVLVDERYGSAIARRALATGIDLAMPLERSGRDFFAFEYSNWQTHVETFDPQQVKVLVHDNPGFEPGDRQAQLVKLAAVSAWLRANGRILIIELLVPSLAPLTSKADTFVYDRDVRPGLTVQLIADYQLSGIEADIWKIEGLETREAATAVVAAARAGGRENVTCIVLGRDAPLDRLDHWLSIAAPVDGFRGFAIGRSIWESPLTELLAGSATEAQLVERVASSYSHFVKLYEASQ